MIRVLRKIIFCGVFVVCALNIYAQAKLENYVSAATAQELRQNGSIKKIHDDGDDILKIVPKSDYTAKINSYRVAKGEKNFPFVYESLYYMKKDFLLKSSNSFKKDITIDDISRIFRSVSKMTGMTYYSTTRKKDLVLYKKAFTIAGPDSKEPVADKTDGSADGKVLYCLQDDASFGECRYKLNYHQQDNMLLAVFTSIDNLGIGPITGIEAGNMRIICFVINCDDGLLLYLATDANCKKVPGIKKQVTDSMSTRIDAVYKWFLKQF